MYPRGSHVNLLFLKSMCIFTQCSFRTPEAVLQHSRCIMRQLSISRTFWRCLKSMALTPHIVLMGTLGQVPFLGTSDDGSASCVQKSHIYTGSTVGTMKKQQDRRCRRNANWHVFRSKGFSTRRDKHGLGTRRRQSSRVKKGKRKNLNLL